MKFEQVYVMCVYMSTLNQKNKTFILGPVKHVWARVKLSILELWSIQESKKILLWNPDIPMNA